MSNKDLDPQLSSSDQEFSKRDFFASARQRLSSAIHNVTDAPPLQIGDYKITRRETLKTAAIAGAGLMLGSKLTPHTTEASVKTEIGALGLQDTLALQSVDRQTLINNPQSIIGKKHVLDQNGDVAEQIILHRNGAVYTSKKLPNGSFEEWNYTAAGKFGLDFPLAFAINPTADIQIAGGSFGNYGEKTALFASLDHGNKFENIWNLGDLGYIRDILPIKGTDKFIIAAATDPGKPSFFILDVDVVNKKTSLIPSTLIRGSVSGLSIASVDQQQNQIKAYATGAYMAESGYAEYTINHQTGETSKSLKHADLGFLEGFFVEKDLNGNPKTIYATNADFDQIIIIDIATDTVTTISYANWRKGDYGAPYLRAIAKINNTVLIGGSMGSTEGPKATVISYTEGANKNPENLRIEVIGPLKSEYPPGTDMQYKQSGISRQNDLEPVKYNGNNAVRVNVTSGSTIGLDNVGEITIQADQNYNLAQPAVLIYNDKGLEKTPPNATATPTATATAQNTETPTVTATPKPADTATPTAIATTAPSATPTEVKPSVTPTPTKPVDTPTPTAVAPTPTKTATPTPTITIAGHKIYVPLFLKSLFSGW